MVDIYSIYPKQFKNISLKVNNKKCFVLMPFDIVYDEIYSKIKSSLSTLDIECNRDDDIHGSHPFMNKVMTEILSSRYIIVVLTGYNPNVIYELGIAHSFKDIQNVLVLIESNTFEKSEVYSKFADISNITYFKYNSSNLYEIGSIISNFVKENMRINMFRDALEYKEIMPRISDQNSAMVEAVEKQLQTIDLITKILQGDIYLINEKNLSMVYLDIFACLSDYMEAGNENEVKLMLNILASIIQLCSSFKVSEKKYGEFIFDFFNNININTTKILEYKTHVILKVAYSLEFLNLSLDWIIRYMEQSKSTRIDLNRYNIEKFLMTVQSSAVDDIITQSLSNTNCYIREHMADVIGEKKICSAQTALQNALSKEENIYSTISIIEALGKIGMKDSYNIIFDWISIQPINRLQENNGLILNHALRAFLKLDELNNMTKAEEFKNKYSNLLVNIDFL